MPIKSSDIKLLQSERMSDASDGGGRRTSRVIVDGEPSNIFPKVSRLDAVYGRVNLRKVYGAVVTASLDVYAGAHAVIMDAPDNDRIHVTLFSTGSDYDTRAAARDRIESYVIAGPESRMVLYGRQLAGQQALLVYQRKEEPLPEIGDVYCLSTEEGGVVLQQQFVLVTDLSQELRTFVDNNGEFQCRVLILKLASTLRNQFDGPAVPSRYSGVERKSLVRSTTVADAARYYGIQKLAQPAEAGALSLQLKSVYSPIVPTTQREAAISLASIGGAGGYASAATAQLSEVLPAPAVTGQVYYLRRPPVPGTLVIAGARDDGNGTILPSPGVGQVRVLSGTVDYETGRVYIVPFVSTDGYVATYTPGTQISQPARTRAIEVTLGNRGTVYSEVLNPPPSPGSTIVDYRALGKWYRLRDDGAGALVGGDVRYGTGTVDYVTGALIATLGELPDVGSSVLISCGSPADFEIKSGASADADTAFIQEFVLEHFPVQPGSLEMSFISDDVAPFDAAYTANDAPGTGVISGNGVDGFVDYTAGRVRIRYTTRIPNAGSIVTVNYSKAELAGGAPATAAGTVNFPGSTTLPQVPIATSSFVIVAEVNMQQAYAPEGAQATVEITDNGAGKLVVRKDQKLSSSGYGSTVLTTADTEVGTINYNTGDLVLNSTMLTVQFNAYNTGWAPRTASVAILEKQMACSYRLAGSIAEQMQRSDAISMADSPLQIDLTKTTANAIVPGALLFTTRAGTNAPRQFIDRSGTIYTNFSQATGSATPCGTIDYGTGIATLVSGYDSGGSTNSISVLSCLTKIGDFSATSAHFRTAGSPIRPASFYVQATAITGELLSGISDQSGNVAGQKVIGKIVQDMGVAQVAFGEFVIPVGGAEPEWRPLEIAPSTLRYSAVVLSSLPLNADILGIDPIRLPSDGRVPIYRPADVAVIHNTKSTELVNPVQAGATYGAGRTGLSELWLVDATGAKVPASQYVPSPEAGSITMAAALDLSGIQQPLKVRHRIEETLLLSDVQINGQLGLTAPLSQAFDSDSYVSSALLFGDMSARYTNLFDQMSWTGEWSDSLIGSGAVAEYNDIDNLIEVLNSGAVTDRWRINFTSGNPSGGAASFQVISENLGVIAIGNTGADCAPVNTLTGEPYFVIRAAGWGLGWAAGNQVRFNTVASAAPFWTARTVLPGATLAGDSFDLQIRGDVDA
jgi:hypothetical protein